MSDFRKYAIIAAGGAGTRMNNAVPKQFLLLRDKTVLGHSLDAFLEAYDDVEIILVLPESHMEVGHEIIQSTKAPGRILAVRGGPTRFHSVKNGLKYVEQPAIVFVHDAVRCLLTTDLIRRCHDLALEKSNAIPAVGAVDSMRIETSEGFKILDRSKVRIIQTPQTFHSDLIKTAYEQEYVDSFTDEASVIERMGIRIHLIEGEEENIKITRPVDLIILDKILENRKA